LTDVLYLYVITLLDGKVKCQFVPCSARYIARA